MKRTILQTMLVAILLAGATLSSAQNAPAEQKPAKPPQAAVVLPPGVTEEMLAPPPMPRFMLEKSAKPLTLDEMVQQAREAEKNAGVKRDAAKKELEPPSPKPQSPTKP